MNDLGFKPCGHCRRAFDDLCAERDDLKKSLCHITSIMNQAQQDRKVELADARRQSEQTYNDRIAFEQAFLHERDFLQRKLATAMKALKDVASGRWGFDSSDVEDALDAIKAMK